MSDQFSNSNTAPFPAFLWSQSVGAGAGKDPDWFHHAPIITVHVYTCLLVTIYPCLLVTSHTCLLVTSHTCLLVTRYTCLLVTQLVTSHTCHLYLLQLVLDDALLVPDGGLQVLVPLEQRVAQLGRQLQVCNITESGYDCNVLVHTMWTGRGRWQVGGRKCAATRRSCKN